MQIFVVPAFNEEANLPRLLLDLEERPELWTGGHVVVVDDGSTDDTAALLEAYRPRYAWQVIRQANAGHPHALNRGISAAQGQ